MKIAVVLCFLSCLLLWECQASPVQIVENHQLAKQLKEVVGAGRQSTSSAGQPASGGSSDDDDEDDDDDDDIEALVDDEDDDDDDDEDEDPKPQGQQAQVVNNDSDDDDDDEDDYLERLFDDILEDDDDDDDEDNLPSSGSIAQPAAVALPQAAVSNVEPSVGDIEGLGNNAIVQSADYPTEGEQTVFYDEENGGIDTKVDIQSLNKPAESVAAPAAAIVQKITAAQPAQNEISADSASDDDDDDEDDITGALDDDDEEDDEEDDDDEDDLIGEGVIEARRTRALEKQTMSDIVTERYNRFVDSIFGRINRILKTSYNPVRVRLAVNNNKKGKAKHEKRKSIQSQSNGRVDNEANLQLSENSQNISSQLENQELTGQQLQSKMIESEIKERESIVRGIPQAHKLTTSSVATNTNHIQQKKAAKPIKPKIKQSGTVSGFQSNEEKLRRAQGTLFGLASLNRTGNVKVTPDGTNSTIKAKFTLGPLTLRVEKAFRRGSNRSVKSATAKTNEIIGRITLRVIDGAATLVSIKVQQPKQVQVDSSDNHDRTREFIWKRTPLIAPLVSDKLKLVVESMLQPVGSEVVHL